MSDRPAWEDPAKRTWYKFEGLISPEYQFDPDVPALVSAVAQAICGGNAEVTGVRMYPADLDAAVHEVKAPIHPNGDPNAVVGEVHGDARDDFLLGVMLVPMVSADGGLVGFATKPLGEPIATLRCAVDDCPEPPSVVILPGQSNERLACQTHRNSALREVFHEAGPTE